MTKRILLLAALGAALMSCRQEEAPLPVPPEPVRMIAEDADPVRVSYGEAVSELEAMLEAMEPGPKTKGAGRRIGKMEAVTAGMRTRSGNLPDTLLYVVDLEGGDGGYAVMSALRSMPSTLVIADQGQGDAGRLSRMISDTPTEADLAGGTVIADMLLANYVRSQVNQLNSSGQISGNIIWITPEGGFGPWYIGKIGPLLETKWGQGAPFNKNLGAGNSAGCSTIAQAQLMAYFQVPESLRKSDGSLFWPAWHLMINYVYNFKLPRNATDPTANEHAATLCEIMIADNKAFFDRGVAVAPIINIARSLNKYGYKNCAEKSGYPSELIKEYLLDNKPFMIIANSSREPACHMWLLDGLEMHERKLYKKVPPKQDLVYIGDEKREYVHCNFGYQALGDGWYEHALFDIYRGPIKEDDYFDRYEGIFANYPYDFCYDLNFKYITYEL